MSVLRFFGFFGRGCLEVWSAVQLVVCMGECTQVFRIRFGGQRVFQCNDSKILFCVCCAELLQKVDLVVLSMQILKFTV